MLVLVLTGTDRPEKGHQETRGQQHAEPEQNHNHAHESNPRRRAMACTASVVKATTVIELTGIRIAATTGDSAPRTANERPMALYSTEIAKLQSTTRRLAFASPMIPVHPGKAGPFQNRVTCR